jgi:hypothetical protein
MSSRAITPDLMHKLYEWNHRAENWTIQPYTPGSRNPGVRLIDVCVAGRTKRAMTLAYILAFTCLLRSDELLKIQFHDIEVISMILFNLNVPLRKTNQFGGEPFMFFISLRPLLIWCCQGVKPFPLHKLPQHQAYLCPVRALADWLVCLRASGINEGYIFPRMNSGDRISHDNRPMVRHVYLSGRK